MTEQQDAGIPAGAIADRTDERGGTLPWIAGWIGVLATVFLSGATLNSLFRWLPYGHRWDLGGFVLSGGLAWGCFQLTMSRSAMARPQQRILYGLLVPVIWAVLLPVLMYSLGFPG